MVKTGLFLAAALLLAQPSLAAPVASDATNATNAAAASPDTGAAAPATNAPPAAAPVAPSTTAAAPVVKPKGGFAKIALPAPPDGKGLVVFFRKPAFQGSAVWFKVRENGVELGKITPGVYFVAVADPGEHTYTAATENKDSLKLQVDAGETYFVEGTITMGFFIGEANLTPSDEAAFDKVSQKLKLASPPPPQ